MHRRPSVYIGSQDGSSTGDINWAVKGLADGIRQCIVHQSDRRCQMKPLQSLSIRRAPPQHRVDRRVGVIAVAIVGRSQ